MNHSKYQKALFDWVRHGQGCALVGAVAGSGKTTSIVTALESIPATSATGFLAFNKSIATELKARVPSHVEAMTLNSLGHRAWTKYAGRFCRLDANKVRAIIDAALTMDERHNVAAVRKLVSLAKAHGLVPRSVRGATTLMSDTDDAWIALIDRFDVDIDEGEGVRGATVGDVIAVSRRVLELSLSDRNTIDFDDQMYMTVALNAPVRRYDWLFVDEAQDVSPIQLALISKALKPGGRLVAVGDQHQCHPAGTYIRLTGDVSIPIDQVKVGMEVVSYKDCFRGILSQGRKVLAVGKRAYKGEILRLSVDRETVAVTPNHRVPTRIDAKARGYVVYLMESGETSRLGTCALRYVGGFGPAMRARQERADRVWVLRWFASRDEALIYETITALKYALPENIFFEKGRIRHALVAAIGNNREQATRCLIEHGRLYEHPLSERGHASHIGKKIYVTQACNLIDGINSLRSYKGTRDGGIWDRVSITREHQDTTVYSLEVEPTEGGLRLYVADNVLVHNSIYGFRGADSESMEKIRRQFNCRTLPLSISYRCPRNIVAYAQRLVPHIEASDSAIDGELYCMPSVSPADFVPDDLIVCRNNKPLVALAYSLIARMVPVTVMGREIGAGLTSLITKLRPRGIEGEKGLIAKLDAWRSKETERALARGDETKAEAIADKADTILCFIENTRATTVPQLVAAIEEMFSDDKNTQRLTLASVHRSKGLEADRVFILDADLMPSKYARQDWQQRQERNLEYVAITRAKKQLIFIRSGTLEAAQAARAVA